jgi:hypothetical protein
LSKSSATFFCALVVVLGVVGFGLLQELGELLVCALWFSAGLAALAGVIWLVDWFDDLSPETPPEPPEENKKPVPRWLTYLEKDDDPDDG